MYKAAASLCTRCYVCCALCRQRRCTVSWRPWWRPVGADVSPPTQPWLQPYTAQGLVALQRSLPPSLVCFGAVWISPSATAARRRLHRLAALSVRLLLAVDRVSSFKTLQFSWSSPSSHTSIVDLVYVLNKWLSLEWWRLFQKRYWRYRTFDCWSSLKKNDTSYGGYKTSWFQRMIFLPWKRLFQSAMDSCCLYLDWDIFFLLQEAAATTLLQSG